MSIDSREMLLTSEGLQMIHDISKMTYIEAKAHVYSLMLFPKNDFYTAKAFAYVCYELVSEEISTHNVYDSADYNRIIGKFLTRIIGRRPGYDEFFSIFASKADDLVKLIKKNQFSGMMIGALVQQLIDNKSNILVETERFSDIMSKYKESGGETPREMTYQNIRNNLWPPFSTVAHLWVAAAEISELRKKLKAKGDPSPNDILECPSLEEIRGVGETDRQTDLAIEWLIDHGMEWPSGLAGFLRISKTCLQAGARTRMSRRGPAGPLFALEDMHDFKLPRGLKFKHDNLK